MGVLELEGIGGVDVEKIPVKEGEGVEVGVLVIWVDEVANITKVHRYSTIQHNNKTDLLKYMFLYQSPLYLQQLFQQYILILL